MGVGYENLGGDGAYGFQTPLATGHAFNGWADQHGVDTTKYWLFGQFKY
ncbi:MAG: hypothetical protein IIA07_08160 [Proteobacteria bacterium]|nr:hypothetical protein [Pseudomonadota bacterium]